ncbi:hypothetical protein F5Y04DRAFT_278852 [Hypomontagnella monticulosa]|nr:hypothetical protein F5Y04DRAFT_278852 [Hypomontagnella monticulosa]
MWNLRTSGDFDWKEANDFWRIHCPRRTLGRFIPANFYDVSEDEFINLINSFNRFSMPIQSHEAYLEDVLGLLHQHPTLEFLCETLKARQRKMAAEILDKVTSTIGSELVDCWDGSSALFPNKNDTDRINQISYQLGMFKDRPSAEQLGKYFRSYVDPPGWPRETGDPASAKPAAPATPPSSTPSGSPKSTPPSPSCHASSFPSSSASDGILPKATQGASNGVQMQCDDDISQKKDSTGNTQPKEESPYRLDVDPQHVEDSRPKIKRKRRSSTLPPTNTKSPVADASEPVRARGTRTPKGRSRSVSRDRSSHHHPSSAEDSGDEGLHPESRHSYATDEDERARKRIRLDNHPPATKPRSCEQDQNTEQPSAEVASTGRVYSVELDDVEDVERILQDDQQG